MRSIEASGRNRSPRAAVRLARNAAKIRADLPLAVFDTLLIAAGYAAVLILRFDGAVPVRYWNAFQVFIGLAIAAHLFANALTGLYGKVWTHASISEARRVLVAGLSTTAALTAVFVVSDRVLPASVVFLGGAFAMLFVGGLRFHSRLFAFQRQRDVGTATRVAVIGAGNAGGSLVREMLRDPAPGFKPVAILDDDPRKHGRHLATIPVIGGLVALREAVEVHGAEQALLAIPSAPGSYVRDALNAAEAADISLKVLPSVTELVDGGVSVRDVRDLEIEDLLGREPIDTDLAAVCQQLRGRRVLITGAGGSIGSEIARQVAVCDPAELVLLDSDETHLHEASATIDGACVEVLADIRDRERVGAVFADHRPAVVFHAAALKHVPILESHPCEAVRTNVLGVEHVIDAAVRHAVERFVFVSSDKAVRPASVMGASKRLGEQILQARTPQGATWCAVRFGNVLGSRGSVIPTFMRQIAQGGPVTVTDPRMTRFFMTIPEAVALVLQAGAFARGGEVFMLDMGRPVRIIDLAERMIRLSGREVGRDVLIEVTGLRPGEKLHEELRAPNERPLPTEHPSIVRLHPPAIDERTLDSGTARLADLAGRGDVRVAKELQEVVASATLPIRLRLGETDAAPTRLRTSQAGRPPRLRAGETDRSLLRLRHDPARARHAPAPPAS